MKSHQKDRLQTYGNILTKAVTPDPTPEPAIKSPMPGNREHLHKLSPEKRERFLGDMAEALGLAREDTDSLPKVFLAEPLLPLKIGIAGDLMDRFAITDGAKRKKIGSILHTRLVRQLSYQRSMLENKFRYDLDGVVSGEITAEHKEYAREKIKEIRAIFDRIKAKRQREEQVSDGPD